MCFAGQPCALGCAWGRPAASTTTSFDQPGGSGRIHQPACGATCYTTETTNGSSTTHHSRGSVDTSKCGQVCSKTKRGGEHAFEWCVHVHSFCHIAEPDARVRAAEVRAGHTEAVEEGDVRAQSRHTAAGAKRVGAVRGQGRATAHANISADIIAPRPRRRAHTRQNDMDATRRRSRATIHELSTINMDTSTNTHSSNSTKHTSSRGLVSASCHKCRT